MYIINSGGPFWGPGREGDRVVAAGVSLESLVLGEPLLRRAPEFL